jgi:Kelch motif/Fibronectin type III domain/Galactose oxidase, central domain
MKINALSVARYFTGITALFLGSGLCAAPLTWFSGPSLDAPASGMATTIAADQGNLLIGGDSFAVQELVATNEYWTYLTPLYQTAIAPGAVTTGGLIILYGGSDGTSATSDVIGYSSSDGSQSLHEMSVARSYLGYAPDKSGNPYAFGGLDDGGQPLASAERYSQDNDTWTAIASLPAARYNFPAVFNRTNYIYLFGGLTNTTSGTEIATVLRYSVSGNNWNTMAPMPVAVAGSAATLGPDGKIYVIGGTSGGIATDAVQVYDPAANSWSLFTPLPEALSSAAAGVDSLGRLVVMGGMDINGNDVSDVWRSQQLNVPDSAPTFTQYPGTNATYLVPYVSAINATGNPQPTYLLVSGPDEMQVDPDTGAITWTPQAGDIGTNSVTVRATNYAGSTDWSFNIVVPNPPPAALTNLTVVSVTENSVTLAWDPESPVVGPVTYSAYLRHVLHDPKGSGATIWYTQIGSTTSLTTMTITGLAAGLTQSYYIVASGAGGMSGYASISATTLSPQPPANLRVTGLTSMTITLAWDASPGPVPVVRYEIWGWINNGVNSTSYGTNFTDTTATITGLIPGSIHEWGVRAYDAAGNVSGFDYGPTELNPVPAAAQLVTVGSPTSGVGFQFSVQAGAIQTLLIQATTNPANPASWTTIATNPPVSNSFIFTDTDAANYPARFYRVLAQ